MAVPQFRKVWNEAERSANTALTAESDKGRLGWAGAPLRLFHFVDKI